MAEKTSPLNVALIKEKIDKGEVKVKGVKTKQGKAQGKAQNKAQAKQHNISGVDGKISDENITAWLKTQNSAVTSTELRDALGFKSRTQARRVLRRLAKAGVVKIQTKQLAGKRKVYSYIA